MIVSKRPILAQMPGFEMSTCIRTKPSKVQHYHSGSRLPRFKHIEDRSPVVGLDRTMLSIVRDRQTRVGNVSRIGS